MASLTVAAAAMQTLTGALNALSSVRERAQASKDSDLKDRISTLYDEMLSLKEAVLRLSDENTQLKRHVAELEQPAAKREPELRQVGAVNYYFDGDKGPCCQPCYDRDGKLIVLTPPETWNGGVRRSCPICGELFYEKPMDHKQVRFSRGGGPDSWMGN